MRSLDEMIAYSREVLYPHTVTIDGFRFTAEGAILDAIDDGVTILEMSTDVRFAALFPGGLDEFVEFIGGLADRYLERIDFRPEIGMSKDRPADGQVKLARACIDSGVFRSIDLYGNELAQPAGEFREAFAYARKRGLKLKAHAGEFGGTDIVEETIDQLQVTEIQHGVAAAQSQPTMQKLRDRNIRLNICPSSNIALGVVKHIRQHPIKTLFDSGVRVTLNTDDLTIFGKSVSEEFLLLYNARLFSADELDLIRLEGLRD